MKKPRTIIAELVSLDTCTQARVCGYIQNLEALREGDPLLYQLIRLPSGTECLQMSSILLSECGYIKDDELIGNIKNGIKYVASKGDHTEKQPPGENFSLVIVMAVFVPLDEKDKTVWTSSQLAPEDALV